MDFQQRLDRLRDRIEGNLPPASVSVMRRATSELRQTGIEDRVTRVGEQVKPFTLPNQDGDNVSLQELSSSGPVVVTFYRGVWCPYCNADLENLQKHVDGLEKAGATLIAISPEQAEFSRKMRRTRRLSFDILVDKHNEVAATFGLRWTVVDPLKSLYRDSLDINLSRYHGDDDWTLPIPARFVIDGAGVVRYAEASADYTRRPDPDGLLDVVRGLC